MKRLKEEIFVRDCIRRTCMNGNTRDAQKAITALVRAVTEDICEQVADAIKLFPKKDQIKLMDAIMQYEKPKAIRARGKGE